MSDDASAEMPVAYLSTLARTVEKGWSSLREALEAAWSIGRMQRTADPQPETCATCGAQLPLDMECLWEPTTGKRYCLGRVCFAGRRRPEATRGRCGQAFACDAAPGHLGPCVSSIVWYETGPCREGAMHEPGTVINCQHEPRCTVLAACGETPLPKACPTCDAPRGADHGILCPAVRGDDPDAPLPSSWPDQDETYRLGYLAAVDAAAKLLEKRGEWLTREIAQGGSCYTERDQANFMAAKIRRELGVAPKGRDPHA